MLAENLQYQKFLYLAIVGFQEKTDKNIWQIRADLSFIKRFLLVYLIKVTKMA